MTVPEAKRGANAKRNKENTIMAGAQIKKQEARRFKAASCRASSSGHSFMSIKHRITGGYGNGHQDKRHQPLRHQRGGYGGKHRLVPAGVRIHRAGLRLVSGHSGLVYKYS